MACHEHNMGGTGDDDTHHQPSILASQGLHFLLSSSEKVPLSSLDQKTICLFFSAQWCRPCRNFTPKLVECYNTLKSTKKRMEIIFISFDRDENGYRDHFKRMPWLAAPFDIKMRRQLCDRYCVSHIPSLIPLGSDGKTVEEDAVQLVEEYGVDAFPFSRSRREELRTMDEAKRRGGTVEDLLASEERDFMISSDGTEVLISDLVGKTIGLYFGGLWCPPCCAFTLQLTEAYNELKIIENGNFQIIFVSMDRDQEEFDRNVNAMPWLAIPYNDRTRGDLTRIFNINRIPALILLGPDGKSLRTNGRTVISTYGAKAFPYTESKVVEVEAAIQKEGEGLPLHAKDPKHEHALTLDMAKAYVCDSCKTQGRFWVFSCNKCDFDLHPTCLQGS